MSVYTATVDPGTTSVSLKTLLDTIYNFTNELPVPRVSILKIQWVDGTITYITDRGGVAVATVASTNGGFQLDTTTRVFEIDTPNINGISLDELFLAGSGAGDTVRIIAIQI
jgi:hypothetical protein